MLTMFLEGAKGSPVSMRRVLAAFFALASVALAVLALPYAVSGWFVFVPAALCIVAVLFLLFFTTWADIATAARALKGEQAPPTP
jgi:hypothetical protein